MNTPDPFSKIVNDLGYVEVKHRNGQTERVEVIEFPIRKLSAALATRWNIGEFLIVCTGKTGEWVDSLTDESAFALYDRFSERNSERLGQWEKRLTPLAEKYKEKL